MINVTIGESKTQEEKPFPKLMIANNIIYNQDTGIIVLFSNEKIGIVVKTVNSSEKKVGYYSDKFLMCCFTDFNEPITLQNA